MKILIIVIIGIIPFITAHGKTMKCETIHRSMQYGVISKCEDKRVECYLSNDNGSNDSRIFCFKK